MVRNSVRRPGSLAVVNGYCPSARLPARATVCCPPAFGALLTGPQPPLSHQPPAQCGAAVLSQLEEGASSADGQCVSPLGKAAGATSSRPPDCREAPPSLQRLWMGDTSSLRLVRAPGCMQCGLTSLWAAQVPTHTCVLSHELTCIWLSHSPVFSGSLVPTQPCACDISVPPCSACAVKPAWPHTSSLVLDMEGRA